MVQQGVLKRPVVFGLIWRKMGKIDRTLPYISTFIEGSAIIGFYI